MRFARAADVLCRGRWFLDGVFSMVWGFPELYHLRGWVCKDFGGSGVGNGGVFSCGHSGRSQGDQVVNDVHRVASESPFGVDPGAHLHTEFFLSDCFLEKI